MRKNDRLAANVLTPTTKAADHDQPISAAEIVDRGLMSQSDLDAVRGWPGSHRHGSKLRIYVVSKGL